MKAINRAKIARLPSTEELNDLIIRSIQDKKGRKIVQLDLRQLDVRPADYFIICEGDSPTQIRTIVQNIQQKVKEELALTPSHVEGYETSNWTLLDYFDTVVHVFYPATRSFYDLEGLWADARRTDFDDQT